MTAWPETALGEVLADAVPGFACGEDVEDGVFQFRMNNITTEGQLDLSKRRRVPRDYRNIDRFLVRPGDVLFNATNSPDLVGKTAFFPGLEEPAVFSNHFLRLRPRDGEIDGRYLTRWLNLQFLHGRFKGMCRQWVNQATVGRDALLSLKVPLPPLSEQRRIAEILDKADALRAKRRAALAQLDTLTQSIFLDMFGDPATNPKGWPWTTLGEIGEFIRGVTFTPDDVVEPDTPAAVACMRTKNVQEQLDLSDVWWIGERFVKRDDQYLRGGDILVSSANSWNLVGKCCWVPELSMRSTFGGFVSVLRARRDTIDPRVLFTWFRSDRVQATLRSFGQQTTNISNLNVQRTLALRLPLPSPDAQRAFCAAITKQEALRERCLAGAAATGQLFAALQDRAFRGDL